ncbi:unnamed protein product, partial [Mesorhabditis belari]|uniref:Tropomodulin n=1 Tax=Mesorhabditis belari TaxID=2138241 RepID=A0AAF3EGF0_9BILA
MFAREAEFSPIGPLSPISKGVDYYAEEQTFAAPGSRTQTGTTGGPGNKIYGKGLKDVDDVDFEGMLGKLSAAELEDLNNDFDPDNSMLPPSQRCQEQTSKAPTGPYKRERLMQFLEDTAKNEKDWDEVVPFQKGMVRGSRFVDENAAPSGKGSGIGGMEMPIALDLADPDDDEMSVEDEEIVIERALKKAPENDLVDLAGILGMHSVLNQPQFYNALKGKGQDENSGTTFSGAIPSYQPKVYPDEPENVTDVDDCINRLHDNDSSLKTVNINNMKRVSKEKIRQLIDAASNSKHIESFSLSNTAIADTEARCIEKLIENSPSLKVVNIESNFITPEMLARLLRATLKTQSIIEFHAENQRQGVLGNQIEMDMMLTVEENEALLRVGIAFQSMEARHRVAEALERNYERIRVRRLQGESNA